MLVAAGQHHRLGAYLPHHALHALGLLGAQAQREAHAVLGDHQADFAFFLVAFVGRADHLDAVPGVEVAGLVVEHVGQVGQGVLGVGHGRLHRLGALRALVAGCAGGFQCRHRVAAQRVAPQLFLPAFVSQPRYLLEAPPEGLC